jgi:hypothetical protein
MPSVEHSTYASALNMSSGTYSREVCSPLIYYYRALQLNVTISGQYRIWSNSSMDTYGSLYQDAFDPVDPSRNQITYDNDGCGNRQFWLQSFLQTNAIYILVVTSFHENTTGPFSVFTLGLGSVSFIPLGKCISHHAILMQCISSLTIQCLHRV